MGAPKGAGLGGAVRRGVPRLGAGRGGIRGVRARRRRAGRDSRHRPDLLLRPADRGDFPPPRRSRKRRRLLVDPPSDGAGGRRGGLDRLPRDLLHGALAPGLHPAPGTRRADRRALAAARTVHSGPPHRQRRGRSPGEHRVARRGAPAGHPQALGADRRRRDLAPAGGADRPGAPRPGARHRAWIPGGAPVDRGGPAGRRDHGGPQGSRLRGGDHPVRPGRHHRVPGSALQEGGPGALVRLDHDRHRRVRLRRVRGGRLQLPGRRAVPAVPVVDVRLRRPRRSGGAFPALARAPGDLRGRVAPVRRHARAGALRGARA